MFEESVKRQLLEILHDVDREIAVHQPRCDASGRCCRFKEYGHTLFMSRTEAELLLEPGIPSDWTLTDETCPFQIEGLCTARDRRPLGCRVYFCDPRFADRQLEISEAFISRLKRMHRENDVNWDYRPLHHFAEEWIASRPPSGSSERSALNPPNSEKNDSEHLISIGPLKTPI